MMTLPCFLPTGTKLLKFNLFANGKGFSTKVHMGPRGPCNICGGPQEKYNRLEFHSDFLVVHKDIT